jgi:hypothetical protein
VLTAPRPRREAVAAALDLCPAGEWIDVDELFRLIRDRSHSALRRVCSAVPAPHDPLFRASMAAATTMDTRYSGSSRT